MSRIGRNEFLAGLADFVGSGLSEFPRVPAKGGSRVRNDFLRLARRAVEDGLDRPSFGVSDLAEALGVSPRHLGRRIRDLTGRPTVQFIRSIRLERARSLIEDGKQSVTDAAQSVNISSLSYFARCFREEFGLNPSNCGTRSAA